MSSWGCALCLKRNICSYSTASALLLLQFICAGRAKADCGDIAASSGISALALQFVTARARESPLMTSIVTKTSAILTLSALMAMPGNAQAQVAYYYGVDLTSNYLSKGATVTDDKPAIQPWFFAFSDIYYAGVWASNTDTDIEFDLLIGAKPRVGDVELDIGLGRYLYRDDPTNFGEVWIKSEWEVVPGTRLGAQYFREFYFDQDWVALTAQYNLQPQDVTVSGRVGTDFGSKGLSDNLVAWDVGASRDLTNVTAIDLRYHDSNLDDGKFALTLKLSN
jgi:uncharacterized protein (TIGR02001 family)